MPTAVPAAETDKISRRLRLDKKRSAGVLNFVLPLGPGRVTMVNDVSDDDLIGMLPN